MLYNVISIINRYRCCYNFYKIKYSIKIGLSCLTILVWLELQDVYSSRVRQCCPETMPVAQEILERNHSIWKFNFS